MTTHAPPSRTVRAAVALAGALGLIAALITVAPPAGAQATDDVTPARIEGETRYHTAAEIALFDHPEGSGVVLLANGNRFPDALAGAPYARPTGAPILLTEADDLPAVTAQTLQDLGAQQVVILGGTAAVSEAVADELEATYQIDRVAGATRFETAAAIADNIRLSPNADIGELDGLRTVVLVNGFAFADAVSAGPLAAGQANPFPILLTEEAQLTATTEAALANLGIEQVIIVGGEAVIDASVQERLDALGYVTDRLAGVDRSDTSTKVAYFSVLALEGFDLSTTHIARGDEFADALTAGPFAGRAQSPILLTPEPTVLGDTIQGFLQSACPNVEVVRAIGGQSAVAIPTLEAAELAAESCLGDAGLERQAEQTYLVAPQEPISFPAGSRMGAQVLDRFDDQAFTGPLNVAIIPCGVSDILGAGVDTFDDTDGDGLADGLGTSDTRSAAIIDVNQRSVPASGQLRDVGPDEDGRIEVGMLAEQPDCVVFVAYDDRNGNDQLDVGDDGVPLEPYGVAQFSWT